MSNASDERDHIRSAVYRILNGTPQRSDGALTIVALDQEADLPRTALTQRHVDRKNQATNTFRPAAAPQNSKYGYAPRSPNCARLSRTRTVNCTNFAPTSRRWCGSIINSPAK
jgi:hypothetical protein